MAGDWIKFRKKLCRDGRVVAMARKCNVDRVTVIGGLVTLWCLGDEYCEENGALPGYTKCDLEREIGIAGFLDSLPPDWFSLDGETPQLPNYQQHNGDTAKRRACTLDRVTRHRATRNGSSVTKALPEKRREEKSNTPVAPKGANGYAACFELWWNQYPKAHRTGKAAAYRAYAKAGKALVARGMSKDQAAGFLQVKAVEFAASPKAQTEFVPNPATWLNQGRYDDEAAAWNRTDKQADDDEPERTYAN